jgi:hypothetical protein
VAPSLTASGCRPLHTAATLVSCRPSYDVPGSIADYPAAGSILRFKPQLTDYANYSRLEDEFRQFNDSDRFHTNKGRGDGWAQFFRWRKEDLDGETHAEMPVT